VRVIGIHCENTRRVVHKALDAGWIYDGKTKSNHGRLTWPESGQQIFFGFTPSDQNSWKRLAFDIERVSGVVVYQRVKRRAGYRPSVDREAQRVARDRAQFAAQADATAARESESIAATRRRMAAAENDAREWARQRTYRDLMQPGRF
jgi:hypothetical protein